MKSELATTVTVEGKLFDFTALAETAPRFGCVSDAYVYVLRLKAAFSCAMNAILIVPESFNFLPPFPIPLSRFIVTFVLFDLLTAYESQIPGEHASCEHRTR